MKNAPRRIRSLFRIQKPARTQAGKHRAGKKLFYKDTRPIPYEICHGYKGDGFGVIFQQLNPYPRYFTCYQTMRNVSDGQLLWVIQQGAHGIRMKGFHDLSYKQIWQLILYLRNFAKPN